MTGAKEPKREIASCKRRHNDIGSLVIPTDLLHIPVHKFITVTQIWLCMGRFKKKYSHFIVLGSPILLKSLGGDAVAFCGGF